MRSPPLSAPAKSQFFTLWKDLHNRKNSLFAGNAGGRTWATLSTLIQTAKMNEADPLAWLTQTLERIAAGWPASDIDALMPWNFKK